MQISPSHLRSWVLFWASCSLACSVDALAAPSAATVAAKGYFVDCTSGNDANAGTVYSAPWRTLGKANSSVKQPGADVWIKAGSKCDDQSLNVDWPGVSESDPAIIGSYYVSDGVAYELRPSNPLTNPQEGFSYVQPRAEINGNYEPRCRAWDPAADSISCPFNQSGAIPSNPNLGLIQINNVRYVTIQDLELRDSGGAGVVFDGTNLGGAHDICTANLGCDMYGIAQRLYISNTVTTGIYSNRGRNFVFREIEVEADNLQWRDTTHNNWGACMVIRRGEPANALLENNYCHDGWGEGIGAYGVSYVLVRGNRVANTRRPYLYFGGDHLVAEQNIVAAGGNVAQQAAKIGNPARAKSMGSDVSALSFTQEPATTAGDSVQIRRSTLLAGTI